MRIGVFAAHFKDSSINDLVSHSLSQKVFRQLQAGVSSKYVILTKKEQSDGENLPDQQKDEDNGKDGGMHTQTNTRTNKYFEF